MCSAHTSPALRRTFSVSTKSWNSLPLRSTPTILSKDFILSLFNFSRVCRSLSVMSDAEMDRKCGLPIIVTPEIIQEIWKWKRSESVYPGRKLESNRRKKWNSQMCSNIFVRSWCVATTLIEQGSAGRTPTSVVKIRLVKRSFLSPYCKVRRANECVSFV